MVKLFFRLHWVPFRMRKQNGRLVNTNRLYPLNYPGAESFDGCRPQESFPEFGGAGGISDFSFAGDQRCQLPLRC
ncbi:hypothetical protein TBK1r_45190 [Stieleria magnilauensis]|uniref:Uncharacterized protein n=1 Tax=Stieleria magnilauensis TaxID=2527963 RepID=A0ABX5XVR0_9BACT|nr:hypothetical protein TBK1r_45190 [Planctomycetes bacterium TBK1r]